MNNCAVCSPILTLKIINQREVSICMFDMAEMFLPDANLTINPGLGPTLLVPILWLVQREDFKKMINYHKQYVATSE